MPFCNKKTCLVLRVLYIGNGRRIKSNPVCLKGPLVHK